MTVSPSILSIIDFSETSKDVLRWSVMMAKRLNVHLTVLHPYRLNQLEKKEDMVAVKKRLDLDAAQNFERIGQGLFNGQKVSVDFRSEVGFIPDRVQDFARRNNILLLVIGVDLAMGTKEGLEEIVKEIEVPLVIIPCAHAKHAANNPAE